MRIHIRRSSVRTRHDGSPAYPESLFCSLVFDEFPAQVAAAYDPALRGRPYVVVRQSEESHKSVAWSVSARARALGAHAGQPLHELRKRFPGIESVAYSEDLHAAVRAELARVLERYTPEVEVTRRGACLLDLSRTPLARDLRPRAAAREIQEAIMGETGLERPAVGMAASALMARIMARLAQRGAVRICPSGREAEELDQCDTRMLPGLSAACRERLRKYGLNTVGQIGRLERPALRTRFGLEGETLYCMARGIDIKDVARAMPPLRVETVLDRDVNDRALLRQYLRRTVDRFCSEARAAARVVHRLCLVIRYTDGKAAQRTIDFVNGTGDYLALVRRASESFDELYARRVGIRSIVLQSRRLEPESGQTELFASDGQEKQRRLGASIAAVRERMDFDAVFTAADQQAHAAFCITSSPKDRAPFCNFLLSNRRGDARGEVSTNRRGTP
jgi:DNA polymerase-4